jgi:hypothetical protein
VPSIYFSSISPLAENYSRKIAHYSESFLETESKVSNYNQNLSKKKIRSKIEEAEKDIKYLNTKWSQSLIRRIELLRDF